MTINWTKCSERMPPDDVKIIIHRMPFPASIPVEIWSAVFNEKYKELISDDWHWTPYTEEAWKELNK